MGDSKPAGDKDNHLLAFPTPTGTAIRAAMSLVIGRPRRFRDDARREIARLSPPLRISGEENIPASGPYLVTVNHYGRPGFWAWWISFAISSTLPADVHWVMTRELTYKGQRRFYLIRYLTRWGIRGLSRVYGFTVFPPMPPNPADAAERGLAVRRLIAYAQQAPGAFIGLAPEGMDMPGAVLGWPPPGSGRVMHHLARQGLSFMPVGAYEEDCTFCLSFGPAYTLEEPSGLSRDSDDEEVRRQVMRRIARQLPYHLRGEFAG